jgi:hypothetical protein
VLRTFASSPGSKGTPGMTLLYQVAEMVFELVILSPSLVILSPFAPFRIALSGAKGLTVNSAKNLRFSCSK